MCGYVMRERTAGIKTGIISPLFSVLWAVAAVWYWTAVPADADPGGSLPAPDLCDYPGIGNSGLDGVGVYHYTCDFPLEENGSRWHCEYGGAASVGNIGISFMMLNAGISAALGVLEGSCSWRCPDGRVSATAPNPPGAWKNYLAPTRCVSVPDPPPPDSGTPGAEGGHLAPVTNPVTPNPVATQNEEGPGD